MKYAVTAEVTISLSATVEAESAEAAHEFAYALGVPTLCHRCTSGLEGEWKVTEIDGEPEIVDLAPHKAARRKSEPNT